MGVVQVEAWWDDTSIYFSKNMKIVSSTSLKKMLF
jgi:hypothetical protein